MLTENTCQITSGALQRAAVSHMHIVEVTIWLLNLLSSVMTTFPQVFKKLNFLFFTFQTPSTSNIFTIHQYTALCMPANLNGANVSISRAQ